MYVWPVILTNGGVLLKCFDSFNLLDLFKFVDTQWFKGLWAKMFQKQSMLWILMLLLTGCMSTPRPQNPENICAVFKQYPSWYKDTQDTAKRWGVPAAVQMAIIYQESSFDAEARPPKRKILWIIPWTRPTSAYGYSQALDATWDMYKKSTHQYFVKRNSFEDATDFVGWYSEQSHRYAGISKYDAYNLYLAYHEGWTGYTRRTYRAKPWLMMVAQKVKYRSMTYQQQLNGCVASLEQNKKWYQF